jgi:hypothetical protein
MPPTTLKQLQAQVELLTVVVKVLMAELPSEATSRVRAALEDHAQEHAPLSEDIDAATAGLVSALVGLSPALG